MAEGRSGSSPSNVRSLNDAIRKVRIAEADRSDGFVDLQEAERARLEMLADELRDVFAEVPAENEQFLFSMSSGSQPRLWIDMTAFVVVGRDRRTYRFLKDTRLGRTVLVETASIAEVADQVTNYIAERMIERERTIEGDWVSKRIRRERLSSRRADGETGTAIAVSDATSGRRFLDGRAAGWVVAGFLAGIMIGAIALLAFAWLRV
jgi:hypothetical protein